MAEKINRGEVSLIHPYSGTYIMIDDDGNLRMGTRLHGDCFFLNSATGNITINCNTLRLVTDSLELNDFEFNESAVSPTQPALIPKQGKKIIKELNRYGH